MDRNPSPPPSDEDDAGGDAIGSTIYSKHWFFSTLSKLIEVVAPQKNESDNTEDNEVLEDLDEEMENEICKVWDMSMNEEVALFLQEFNAPEIVLGVIAKSRCPRLTEICVGILGNMACFQETCLSVSKHADLGEVLLLLLEDSDPPTLLETSRLLSTCLSQPEVATIWTDRIRNHPSVCDNICFIMSSSTNADLLVKVGEVVDKVFDIDEDLMLSWIKPHESSDPPPSSFEENQLSKPEIVPCLLEAAKQLRSDHSEGLDVYMHILQLLTTVDEGIQTLVHPPKVGQEIWSLLYDITCRDLCQPDDPAIIIQEQKTVLASILSVLSAMLASQTEQDYMKIDKNIPLIGSLIRILQFMEDCQKRPFENSNQTVTENTEEADHSEKDLHLEILKDICTEFLSNVLSKMSKENISEGLKQGYLSEKMCTTAFQNLLPLYSSSVKNFFTVLEDADQRIANNLAKEFTCLRPCT